MSAGEVGNIRHIQIARDSSQLRVNAAYDRVKSLERRWCEQSHSELKQKEKIHEMAKRTHDFAQSEHMPKYGLRKEPANYEAILALGQRAKRAGVNREKLCSELSGMREKLSKEHAKLELLQQREATLKRVRRSLAAERECDEISDLAVARQALLNRRLLLSPAEAESRGELSAKCRVDGVCETQQARAGVVGEICNAPALGSIEAESSAAATPPGPSRENAPAPVFEQWRHDGEQGLRFLELRGMHAGIAAELIASRQGKLFLTLAAKSNGDFVKVQLAKEKLAGELPAHFGVAPKIRVIGPAAANRED